MKITKSKLKQIISEELKTLLAESAAGWDPYWEQEEEARRKKAKKEEGLNKYRTGVLLPDDFDEDGLVQQEVVQEIKNLIKYLRHALIKAYKTDPASVANPEKKADRDIQSAVQGVRRSVGGRS